MSQSQTADGLIGRTLGDFVIRERLGAGGFGVVYGADQPLLGRQAVIKTIRDAKGATTDAVQRFLREARLASRLDHPYAAHVYAFGAEADGLLWIAMERVHGVALDKLLNEGGPLPLIRFVSLMERICEVVHSAHDRGIIHRDLKPANVMVVSRAGKLHPKLLDFGIARLQEEPSDETPAAPASSDPPVSSMDSIAQAVSDQTLSGRTGPIDLARAESMELTQRGLIIGSPHYMAPEQWINAREATACTDVYALGILSYQCLTGTLPFAGNSVRMLARAHAKQPLPELSDAFPPALTAVLRRATAKRAEDRFATALEFAEALRAASGLDQEPPQLPQLDDEVRATVLSAAPHPIAEAVSALEAARSAAKGVDAVRTTIRTVLRYLGLCALASRARVGPGGALDGERSLALLTALRRKTLADRDWLDLSIELCRPFVARRHLHPLPELVSLFFDDGGKPTAALGHLEAATGFLSASPPLESAAAEALTAVLPGLGRTLEALSFLNDYPLAVGRAPGAERWMGVGGRRARATIAVQGEPLAAGECALLTAEGACALSLSPLIQVMAPAPGAPEELFLLEGNGRHGALLVSLPQGFERHDPATWSWFKERMGALGSDEAPEALAEKVPYRGLSAFTSGDAANFFGREVEAEESANRLRLQHLLAVVGPSGAGKSSFVQAGVIPALSQDWTALVVRPGASPLASLVSRLAQAGVPVGSPNDLLRAPGLLAERMSLHPGRVLLLVDQFEELITLCLDARERQAYAEALVTLADTVDNVRVALTLRDDFLIRVQQLAPMRRRLTQSIQLVATPAREDLVRILVEPARKAGYEFEDAELPRQMVEAVADQPGALALLSFTASKLWEFRDRHFRRLTRAAYQSLGGVGGALAQHAEATLQGLGPEEDKLVRETFRALVTADGTRAVLSRKELEQLLGGSRTAQAILEKLIVARLLVSSEVPGGEDRIEVIHETLLSSWPRLVKWQREDAENARLRDQLRAAARQWEQRGRPKGVLWRGDALVEYRLWRARYPGALTHGEEAFAQGSVHEEARGRRIRRTLLLGAFVALAAGIALLTLANRRAELNRRAAQDNLAQMHMEHGRRDYLAGHAVQAFPYLSRAYEEGLRGPGIRYLLARGKQAVLQQQLSLEGHLSGVSSAEFSPDDAWVTTGGVDGSARIWSASTGELVLPPLVGGQPLRTTHFSPGGEFVLTAGSDPVAHLWSTKTGQLVRSFVGHTQSLQQAEFSADGKWVMTASDDGAAGLWEASTGKLLRKFDFGVAQGVDVARLSPNGRYVVATEGWKLETQTHLAKVWDATSGNLLFEIHHAAQVSDANFSPDGSLLVTGSSDSTVKIWEVPSGRLRVSIGAHPDGTYRTVFDPTGTRVASIGMDNTARVWDAKDGHLLALMEAGGNCLSVSFSPDGTRLAASTRDATAFVWNATTGRLLRRLEGHSQAVGSLSFSHDGRRLVTASRDRTAKIWNAVGGTQATTIDAVMHWAWFDPSGEDILGVDGSGVVRRWSAQSGQLISQSRNASDSEAAVSPDGQFLLTEGGKLRSVGTGQLIKALPMTPTPLAAAFDAQSRRLLISDVEGTVSIFELPSGELERAVHAGLAATALAYDSTRHWLATGHEGGLITMTNAATSARLFTLEGHERRVGELHFARDGRELLSAADDQTARIWDLEKRVQKRRFDLPSPVSGAVLADNEGLLLTTSLDGVGRLWDADSGTELDDFPMGGIFARALFSPQADRVLTSGASGVAVWSIGLERSPPAEISAFERCFVPFRLEGERLQYTRPQRAECATDTKSK